MLVNSTHPSSPPLFGDNRISGGKFVLADCFQNGHFQFQHVVPSKTPKCLILPHLFAFKNIVICSGQCQCNKILLLSDKEANNSVRRKHILANIFRKGKTHFGEHFPERENTFWRTFSGKGKQFWRTFSGMQ